MAASRINLVNPVRQALIAGGYSTVKVVNAINAALGQLEGKGGESKTGNGTLSKDTYKVSVTTTEKFIGARNVPLTFDTWHGHIAKANKVAEFDGIIIPGEFIPWLEKMKATDEELAVK